MGGREVGGLANMLAAHMGFSAPERDRVRRFWNAPNLVEGEGHKAVRMFEAVAAGEIKLLWVMGTNPAVSLPRADHVREALGRLELWSCRERRQQRHGEPGSCAGAGRGVGREGRHGHQLRAAYLAPAGVPRAARRSTARLVESCRRWRPGLVGRRPSPTSRQPTSSASMRACPASRTTASACSTSRALQA